MPNPARLGALHGPLQDKVILVTGDSSVIEFVSAIHPMNLPLALVVLTLGCSAGFRVAHEPEVIDVALSELPEPILIVEVNQGIRGESVRVEPAQDYDNGPCHRLPAQTRLTANGQALRLKARGAAAYGNTGSDSEQYYCVTPSFAGPELPAEPRTEFLLSDGVSSRRAVFMSLRVPRHLRVNGQEHATVRSGEPLDIEWFPETDNVQHVLFFLSREDGTRVSHPRSSRREGNHLHITFDPAPAGSYLLQAMGEVSAGVEVCEGFRYCMAYHYLSHPQLVSAPLTLEAPDAP